MSLMSEASNIASLQPTHSASSTAKLPSQQYIEFQDVIAGVTKAPLDLANFVAYCKSQYNQESIQFYIETSPETFNGDKQAIARIKQTYIAKGK